MSYPETTNPTMQGTAGSEIFAHLARDLPSTATGSSQLISDLAIMNDSAIVNASTLRKSSPTPSGSLETAPTAPSKPAETQQVMGSFTLATSFRASFENRGASYAKKFPGTIEWRSKPKPTNGSSGSSSRGSAASSKNWRVKETSATSLQASTNEASAAVVAPPPIPADVTITKDNAQEYYTPDCCLFVANLCQLDSDVDIEAELVKAFQVFGIVYVKVTRDKKHMPQGHVQFTCRGDALNAIQGIGGKLLTGRKPRVEWSNACVTYYLARLDGTKVTFDIAQDILKAYGPIKDWSYPDSAEIDTFPLGLIKYDSGIKVTFFNFLAGVNATKSLNPRIWKIAALPKGPPVKTLTAKEKESTEFLSQAYADSCSIFIGNISDDVLETDLATLVNSSGLGRARSVQFNRRKSSRDDCEWHNFAFVQLANPNLCMSAVDKLHGTSWKGSRIKVQLKKSNDLLYGPGSKGQGSSSSSGQASAPAAPPAVNYSYPHNVLCTGAAGAPWAAPAQAAGIPAPAHGIQTGERSSLADWMVDPYMSRWAGPVYDPFTSPHGGHSVPMPWGFVPAGYISQPNGFMGYQAPAPQYAALAAPQMRPGYPPPGVQHMPWHPYPAPGQTFAVPSANSGSGSTSSGRAPFTARWVFNGGEDHGYPTQGQQRSSRDFMLSAGNLPTIYRDRVAREANGFSNSQALPADTEMLG